MHDYQKVSGNFCFLKKNTDSNDKFRYQIWTVSNVGIGNGSSLDLGQNETSTYPQN